MTETTTTAAIIDVELREAKEETHENRKEEGEEEEDEDHDEDDDSYEQYVDPVIAKPARDIESFVEDGMETIFMSYYPVKEHREAFKELRNALKAGDVVNFWYGVHNYDILGSKEEFESFEEHMNHFLQKHGRKERVIGGALVTNCETVHVIPWNQKNYAKTLDKVVFEKPEH